MLDDSSQISFWRLETCMSPLQEPITQCQHATVFTQTGLLFAQFSREFLISDKSLGRTARPT